MSTVNHADTEKVLQTIKKAEKEQQSIQDKYDSKRRRFEAKVFKTVLDISEMHKAAAFISEAFDLLKSTYAEYTALILSVDRVCRPLIERVETVAIGKVAELLKSVHDVINDTGIEFTAEVNGRGKNDIADVKASTLTEIDILVSYWEKRFRLAPDYKEAKQLIEDEEDEKEAAAKNDRKALQDEIKRDEKKTAAIKKQNEAYEKLTATCDDLVIQFETEANSFVAQQKNRLLQEQQALVRKLTSERKQQEEILRSAGLFAFSLKKETKASIQFIDNKIERAKSPEFVSRKMDELNQKSARAIQKYRSEMDAYINGCYQKTTQERTIRNPLALERHKLSSLDRKRRDRAAGVLSVLENAAGPMTNEDIVLAACTDIQTTNAMAPLLDTLIEYGFLESQTINGKKHYSLAEEYIVITDEIWVKTSEADSLTCPQAPMVQSVFSKI